MAPARRDDRSASSTTSIGLVGSTGPAVTDSAIEKIKQMIISGELAPGDRLPREPDLAERLGLSRSSLREAVKALSLIGVLDVRQGDGTYVTSLEPGRLLGTMEFVVDFHRDDSVLHFLEVRRILEPAATAMACGRMSDDAIDALDAHLDLLPADPSVEELVGSDLAFHRMIVLGSGNPVLCSLLDSLTGPIQRARLWRGRTEADALNRTTREHRAIVTALRSRHPDVAAAASVAHIFGVENWLRSVQHPTVGPTDTADPTRPTTHRPARPDRQEKPA